MHAPKHSRLILSCLFVPCCLCRLLWLVFCHARALAYRLRSELESLRRERDATAADLQRVSGQARGMEKALQAAAKVHAMHETMQVCVCGCACGCACVCGCGCGYFLVN